MKEWADTITRVIESIKSGNWTDGLDWLTVLRTTFDTLDKDAFNFARGILQTHVDEMATGIASDVARQWRAGEFNGDRDAVTQAVEESCDSACTHIQVAQFVLAISPHDDAYLDEMGELSVRERDGIPWSALATFALRRDVYARLAREPGVDLDEDPPDEPLTDCGSCGDWKPGKNNICNECREEDEED